MCVLVVTLKNDDAENSEEEGDDEEAIAEHNVLLAELAKRQSSSRQPTGRVVGVIKRNWRQYVLMKYIMYPFPH